MTVFNRLSIMFNNHIISFLKMSDYDIIVSKISSAKNAISVRKMRIRELQKTKRHLTFRPSIYRLEMEIDELKNDLGFYYREINSFERVLVCIMYDKNLLRENIRL